MNRIVRTLATVSCMAMLTAMADTATWKVDVLSGSWTNAENWTDGVEPDAVTSAEITNSGADYAITLDAASTLSLTNVTIGNSAGLTTLDILSPIKLFYASDVSSSKTFLFKQQQGARTTVGAGGEINWVGPRHDGSDSTAKGFIVEKSDFIVDGGKVDLFTQLSPRLVATKDAPASIIITNGGYFAWGHKEAGYGKFHLPAYSKVHVHNGALGVSQSRNWYYPPVWNMSGGELEFSGTGVLSNNYKRADGGQGTTPLVFRTGKVVFRDQAQVVNGAAYPDLCLSPNRSGETTEISFLDSSVPCAERNWFSMTVGDSVGGGLTTLNYATDKQLAVANSLAVGLLAGVGKLNLSRGTVFATGQGLFVGDIDTNYRDTGFLGNGQKRPSDLSVMAPTGIVTVVGGALNSSSMQDEDPSGYGFYRFGGMIVGDALTASGVEGRPTSGRLEVHGGAVTNTTGRIIVGGGAACGTLIQTGGNIQKGSGAWEGGSPCAIGLAGGKGEWVVSNGVSQLYTRLFIGGAYVGEETMTTSDNDMHRSHLAYRTYSYPFAAHDSVGKLTIACHDKSAPCTFKVFNVQTYGSDPVYGTAMQGIWVGRNGTGTVEMIGSGGTLECQDLVLTNGYVSTTGELYSGGQATVRCVLDEDGINPITVTRNLKIAPNAKLEVEVDAYKYQGKARKLKILDCVNRSGAFAPGNIIVKGSAVVLQDEKLKNGNPDPDIYVKIKPGMMLILR